MSTKSRAKLKMIELAKHPMGEDFPFTVPGDADMAKKFVAQMRVELSRARDVAQKRGLTTIPFRVHTISMEPRITNGQMFVDIVLRKVLDNADTVREISEALSGLTFGGVANNA